MLKRQVRSLSLNSHRILYFKYLAGELKDKAADKVEAVNETANEVAAEAKEKSAGKSMPHINENSCLCFPI